MNRSTHESFTRDEAAQPGSDRTFGLVMTGALALVSLLNGWHFGRVWPWTLTAAGQGPFAAQTRFQCGELLDRARPRTRAGNHERPVLMMDFLAELWRFMRVRKKFWLLPILIMMVVFGGLVVLTKGSVFAPFIYTLF